MNHMSVRSSHPSRSPAALLWAGVWLAALGGCASTKQSSAAERDARAPGAELPEAERYFPLIDGHIYHYSSRGHDGREGFMVSTVKRDGNTATLTTGSTVQRLTIRPDGIYNEVGYYLLKLPIRLGAQWIGQSGTVEIVRHNQSVITEAGTFSNCIVTRETIQGTVELRTADTTFCPGVGLVRLDVEAKGAASSSSESVTLKYYGAPIDVSAL